MVHKRDINRCFSKGSVLSAAYGLILALVDHFFSPKDNQSNRHAVLDQQMRNSRLAGWK